MNKQAYAQLIHEWDKHKKLHIRSKLETACYAITLAVVLSYLTLCWWDSTGLFVFFIVALAARVFYIIAKGDWFDVASQFGLKCWHCDTVFNRDHILKPAFDRNACPHCQKALYE